MSLLDLSQWQFAITVMFHMTFPAITVGLSIFLSVLYGMHWKTGNPVYLQMIRFWRRIFAVGFAIGVVAGIVITFEMGLNWGIYAAKTGPIIGPIVGMEVVTAFFVEAGFIGNLLCGDGRVRPATIFAATVMVAIGTLLSSSWIIAANSWMQTRAGYVIRDGRFEPTNWIDVIFNSSFIWRWPHMVVAVLISACFFVAGIGAWYLVKGRALPFPRRSVSIALGVAAILVAVQLFLRDHVAGAVLPQQLPKLEALEGNWNSTTGARSSSLSPTSRRNATSRRFHPLLGELHQQGSELQDSDAGARPDPDHRPADDGRGLLGIPHHVLCGAVDVRDRLTRRSCGSGARR
jgi:cytochrome d ubiquinol oxidase subunit I